MNRGRTVTSSTSSKKVRVPIKATEKVKEPQYFSRITAGVKYYKEAASR